MLRCPKVLVDSLSWPCLVHALAEGRRVSVDQPRKSSPFGFADLVLTVEQKIVERTEAPLGVCTLGGDCSRVGVGVDMLQGEVAENYAEAAVGASVGVCLDQRVWSTTPSRPSVRAATALGGTAATRPKRTSPADRDAHDTPKSPIRSKDGRRRMVERDGTASAGAAVAKARATVSCASASLTRTAGAAVRLSANMNRAASSSV